MSMIELKERAQSKIEGIQKANRDKSMAKIKQLTEQHQKEGKQKVKQSKADKSMFDDLEAGEDSDNKQGETSKKWPNGNFKNKGKVHESKQKNKRQQKEANKSVKLSRAKGIIDLEPREE